MPLFGKKVKWEDTRTTLIQVASFTDANIEDDPDVVLLSFVSYTNEEWDYYKDFLKRFDDRGVKAELEDRVPPQAQSAVALRLFIMSHTKIGTVREECSVRVKSLTLQELAYFAVPLLDRFVRTLSAKERWTQIHDFHIGTLAGASAQTAKEAEYHRKQPVAIPGGLTAAIARGYYAQGVADEKAGDVTAAKKAWNYAWIYGRASNDPAVEQAKQQLIRLGVPVTST